ncbi:MAG: hypothetical protein VYB54_15685 [Pseudomonadota bacterium]|nr:hypothetical protein [Pseudomonadota bacterium]
MKYNITTSGRKFVVSPTVAEGSGRRPRWQVRVLARRHGLALSRAGLIADLAGLEARDA